MTFKLPTSWRGKDGKKEYEDIMSGKYKKPETQKSFEKKP